MPAIRTFARPVNDSVTVHTLEEYRSYPLEIIVLPVTPGDAPFFDESTHRKEEADRAYAYLMAQDDGGIEPGWHFDRDEANSR